ncbi:MAG: NAD(P)-dependent alcohol dehydrogenase [Firmicutes bacterium]|nr:NAD(P)-dependent alcohol dehydrogenase [Bacillota bacterium]
MSTNLMRGYGMVSPEKPGWLEKERPACGPLDAILRPTLVAPCTSDTHVMHGGAGYKKNLILGHEAIGEVVEVGPLVTRFKPGDVVVVPCSTPDWMAPNIQLGKSNAHDYDLMTSFKFLTFKDGVFAELFHVNQADANLALLPPDVSPEAALMTVDMMSTGFHGVELADIGFGDKVCVIGIGPVGLMAVAGAAIRGAGQIIAIGTRPNCVKIAKEYGATDIVSYKEGDIVQQVIALTGGGADKVIIAGGNQETFGQAVAMTRAMGTIANINFFDLKDTLSMPAWHWGLGMSNKDIRCGFCPGGAVRIQRLMELIRHGRVDPGKLITHRFHGFDQIDEAFHLMDRKDPDLIKPVIYID